ncbi:AraC family transcriptional regulator ligand-binding domain-containing protein [Ideonella sp. DXS29W]|uniref:AraC family transcriptional regulator ligand-binding domain-containing protein n=1 Tax=Ideonella lacteola TaxID=2984193 RepID=A0ABU9BTM7_9BURK
MTLALAGGAQLHRPPAGRAYEADTAFLPGHHHAGLLFEYARQRELTLPAATQRLAQVPSLSPRDLLGVLADVARADAAPDTAFLLAQAWWPGHAGSASHALAHAADLAQALSMLVSHSATLSPLLTPRCLIGPRHAVLYWLDAVGAPAQRNLLVDLHLSAFIAMSQWLSGQRWPWVVCLNRTEPRDRAQLDTYLGASLRFGCQFDALLIDAQCLHSPWPRGQGMAAQAARRAAEASTQAQPVRSVLAALYDHLLSQLLAGPEGGAPVQPTLDQACAHFGTSPASFKRLLARHGTHFQAELDQVRAHLAMHWFQHEGLPNEAVARQLGFHDSTNFRRSFKRWTGTTPSLLRAALGAVGL